MQNVSLPAAPWALTPDDVAKALETSREGLTEKEAEARLKHFGMNALPQGKKLDALGILAQQCRRPLIFVLTAASALTIALGEWLDTAVIVLTIFVNAGLGFYQEFHAENALQKLSTYVRERTRVIRDEIEQEIDSSLLVPGDILRLSYGTRVPADARVIENSGLSVDESILTGESLPVAKNADVISEGAPVAERTNMVFGGTLVVEGFATAITSATDDHMEIGRIAELVSGTSRERTPLQSALWRLAWFIFAGLLILIAGIFILGILRGEAILEMLLMAAAISVGAIPSALPIALTVILAMGVVRLAAQKGIMRSLAAAETLGSATVVMTDKTGTLTEGTMRLVDVLTKARLVLHKKGEALGDNDARSPSDTTHLKWRMGDAERDILESAVLGTDVLIENPSEKPSEWKFIGRPLETSIVEAAHRSDIDVRRDMRNPPLLPFSSSHKFSIVCGHDGKHCIVLGAPDVLLARSSISKDEYIAAMNAIHAISAEGKRLVGVAKLPEGATHALVKKGVAKPEDAQELLFLGLLVMQDPVRKEAREAMEKIEHLGARVVMLTGDLKGTAEAVARELGWELNEGNTLTGDDLKRLSDEELLTTLQNIKIFARVTPEDKLRIGSLYKKQGEVVAMTGDGVNDAPSLKAVDIGIALGSGSDVAKSTSDLVLLDDNFKTIVAAIEEGRRILQNIRKSFTYLMSNSLDEVALIGGSLLAGLPLPLTALQIIWVNFITGSLPALSFAFDKNFDDSKKHEPVLNSEVRFLTIGVGVATSVLLFILYWVLLRAGIALEAARSIIFICFAAYILVAAYSFRSLRRPLFSYPTFDNRALNWSVAAAGALTILSVTAPFLGYALGIAMPRIELLWIVALWLVLNVAVIEAAKWGFRKFKM